MARQECMWVGNREGTLRDKGHRVCPSSWSPLSPCSPEAHELTAGPNAGVRKGGTGFWLSRAQVALHPQLDRIGIKPRQQPRPLSSGRELALCLPRESHKEAPPGTQLLHPWPRSAAGNPQPNVFMFRIMCLPLSDALTTNMSNSS